MTKKNILVKALALLVIICLAVWLAYKFIPVRELNLSSIRDYIDSYGPFAAIVYILLFSLRTLLVVLT